MPCGVISMTAKCSSRPKPNKLLALAAADKSARCSLRSARILYTLDLFLIQALLRARTEPFTFFESLMFTRRSKHSSVVLALERMVEIELA